MSSSDDSDHSDEADDVSESELQREEEEAERKSRKEEKDLKRTAVNLNNASDDSDDDDDYDSEEDQELHPSHKKKKRRRGVQDFFIDEAEVDDDGDEEDEEYTGGDNDLLPPEDDDAEEVGPSAPEIESRRRLEDIFNQDEEEIERYYKSRYEDNNIADRFGGGEGMVDDITQQGKLPGVKDPNLWVVKCRIGEEKATVVALMRKMLAYQFSDEPLQIKSALTKEGLNGYIYIEAYKQTHVKQAIEGIGALSMGKWTQKMVAIKEMTDVMRVVKETSRLHAKQWVRLKRSVFKGDLAQVMYVEDAQNTVGLRLLPRINFNKKRGVLRHSATDEEDTGRKSKRPPQAVFNTDRIRACGGEFTSDGDHYIFEGNRYDSDGFLHKTFNMNAIIVDGIKPSLAELEKFNESPENVRIDAAMKKGSGEVEHSFAPGDDVEVCEGELNNLHGKVLSVDGNQIIVLPSHNDLKEPIAFQPGELKKYFEPGKHVKVISGRYENDTGLVIRVENNVAMILSDLTMSEIKVAPKDLQLCQERATGVDSSGHFQFGDLIQVDPQTVGVIVRLEKELFEVLTIQNKVIRLKQNVVLRRRETKNAQAYDFERRCIQAKDIVNVCDGPHSGLQGEIRHIYRSWAFIHSRMFTENGGLFVARTRHLSLRGGGGIGMGGGGKQMTNAGGGYAPQSPRLAASPAHPSQGGGDMGGGGNNKTDTGGGRAGGQGGGFGGPGGRNQRRQDKNMIGQTVRVIRGVLKGSIGIVKDVTDTEFSVELHYPYKTVLVKKENVGVTDSSGQIVGARFGASTGRATPTYGGRTPMHGNQTPMYGLRTPMYGSTTPMHDGSRTPHYGSQTPRPESGGQTPRATAFDPAGATPAHHGMGSATPGGTSGHDALFESSPGGSSSLGGAMSSPIGSGSVNLGSLGPFTPLTPGNLLTGGGGVGGSSSAHGGISPMSSPASVRTPDHYQSSPGVLYSPMGSVAPYTPATPGGLDISGGTGASGAGDTEDGFGGSASSHMSSSDNLEPVSGSYLAESTMVQVSLAGSGGGMLQRAVIKSVSGGVATVLLTDGKREMSVPVEQVYRQEPEAGDKVRVIQGNNVVLGDCLSVDNGEGVIKLNPEGTLKLFSLNNLIPYQNYDKMD